MGNIPRPRSITERAPVGWECGECRLEPVGINVAGTMQIEGMTLSSSTHTAGLDPDRLFIVYPLPFDKGNQSSGDESHCHPNFRNDHSFANLRGRREKT